jgi:carboxylesterase
MLRRRFAALTQRFVTLEDGRYGRLVGTGDPSAIRVDGDVSRPGVLAFHGFAGTPNEVRLMMDVAVRLGLSGRAPRLPGHDHDVRNLLKAGWDDWTASASAALMELGDATGQPVVVSGLSMGALLAAHLAAAYPERVSALVVMGSATYLRAPSPRLVLRLCEILKPFRNGFYVPKASADIRDAEARRAHLTYDVTPMRSAIEVLRAGRLVTAELSRITCPTLVVHGALDQVCPVQNAVHFARALGTDDVAIAIMPRSGHIVSCDADRAEVLRIVEAFVRRVSAESATRSRV